MSLTKDELVRMDELLYPSASEQTEQVIVTPKEQAVYEAVVDPGVFIELFLHRILWSKQLEICYSILNNRITVVKACHGSGKTFVSALLALWWLARYPRSLVITTAPTDLQVRKQLWGEIHAGISQSALAYPKPNQTELKLNEKRYAIGFATSVTDNNEGVKFQGFHEDNTLIIVDEAPGIHPGIWKAIAGIRAGGNTRVLALGNPTIASGKFYEFFADERGGANCITISAFDTPNLRGLNIDDLLAMEEAGSAELDKTPFTGGEAGGGLTSRRWVVDMYHEWGPQNPLYQARVLGEFPVQSDSSLISLTWLEHAKDRTATTEGDIYIGLDVAGPGEDETCLVIRKGANILLIKAWPTADPRTEILLETRKYKGKIVLFNVDVAGIGYYLYLALKDEFGDCVQPIGVGEASENPERYANLKAELYWNLREVLESEVVTGMTDDKAIGQLAGIRWKITIKDQIAIEKKEDARKRGVKSPDRAEAVMLCFAKPMVPGAGLLAWMEQKMAAGKQSKAITVEGMKGE